ncbi:MAG TPA: PEP-CTERM sorting domain-containing protein [Tepidisphaeraceae bacterium]|nr:PEP-CTERM sorting domain-containing protein [Tepidisphaeraceae bacterium]
MDRAWKATLGLGIVLGIAAWSRAAIDVTVATDKAAYVPGEALRVLVTARNTDDSDVTLHFPSSLQAQYAFDRGEFVPYGGSCMFTQVTIPANGSYTWDFRHRWAYDNLALGSHDAFGRISGSGNVGPASFRVVQPTYPRQSFMIDFDTVPGTSTAAQWLEEYWPSGVHFRSVDDDMPVINREDGRSFASVYSCSYPTGFNIAADFDMPVYGATVDVSTATGCSVTLLAKDGNGQILDSITSPLVTEYKEFSQLSVHSDQPIASLEWWPSQNNATVLIDNLYLVVPEPGTMTILAMGGALLAGRRRSRLCA